MRKIILLQGANVGHVWKRQPEIYGTATAADLDRSLTAYATSRGVALEIVYTHIEGEAISSLYKAANEGAEGVLMNPGGFLHGGFALRDCLRGLGIPCVEIHMTNIEKRGMKSVTIEAALGAVIGFGMNGYQVGLDALLGHLDKTAS